MAKLPCLQFIIDDTIMSAEEKVKLFYDLADLYNQKLTEEMNLEYCDIAGTFLEKGKEVNSDHFGEESDTYARIFAPNDRISFHFGGMLEVLERS